MKKEMNLETKTTAGSLANMAGKQLENSVEDLFNANGVTSMKYSEWLNSNLEQPSCMLLKHVPYRNIYGGRGFGEFLFMSNKLPPVRIECRYQNSPGSVDEKLPFLFANCVNGFNERDVIIVLEGNGYKPGAVEWFKSAVESIKFKNIKVFNLSQFNSWLNNSLYGVNTKTCNFQLS